MKETEEYWCSVCDQAVVATNRRESGKVYSIFGDTKDNDYVRIFFAVCPDCELEDAVHVVSAAPVTAFLPPPCTCDICGESTTYQKGFVLCETCSPDVKRGIQNTLEVFDEYEEMFRKQHVRLCESYQDVDPAALWFLAGVLQQVHGYGQSLLDQEKH